MVIDISNLEKAHNTLLQSMNILKENEKCEFADMLEDSCVKRFEYTLEIARKLMKKVLKKIYGKSEEELTVNNIFRFMQLYNFVPNWENWRGYYEQRNNTAHEYNQAKSRELLDIIPMFIKDTAIFIQNLKEKIND